MGTVSQADDHYFTSQPTSASQRRSVSVELAGQLVTVETAAGIFSPSAVDRGTSALLRNVAPPPPRGTFLDLGCGWGPIALTMALLSPEADVWAVDVNERAVQLLRDNAHALQRSRVTVALPQDVPGDLAFDLIWSNPPIRIGKVALHQVLMQWLPRLAPGGSAYLVVAKDLGGDSLHRWLATDGLGPRYTVRRTATDKAFRILQVTAPPRE